MEQADVTVLFGAYDSLCKRAGIAAKADDAIQWVADKLYKRRAAQEAGIHGVLREGAERTAGQQRSFERDLARTAHGDLRQRVIGMLGAEPGRPITMTIGSRQHVMPAGSVLRALERYPDVAPGQMMDIAQSLNARGPNLLGALAGLQGRV